MNTISTKVIILAFDVGTTGIKSCLFAVGPKTLELIDATEASYPLMILKNGGAEQQPEDWWQALHQSTTLLLSRNRLSPGKIGGITFCSQMQALVLVDQLGRALRPAMIYMDQRAGKEMKETIGDGIKVAGVNLVKLLISIRETGAVNASVKDPVWKYHWVKKNEPELFKKVFKWLDVKEYLIGRLTDSFLMTEDSAFAALLYDNRRRNHRWSVKVCKMLDVNLDHLPPIIRCTDQAGQVTKTAAAELGLVQGIPVFGGGGDASLIGIGAGAVHPGDTHIYTGTSGWVSTVVKKPIVDPSTMIAAIIGAQTDSYNYFAEMETAGKCLEWVKDHLALDLVGIYKNATLYCESPEAAYRNLYAHLTGLAEKVPAGSKGLIFTPWLHGNRCPFEDSRARGIFFNLSLETGKSEMIRAVIEGVCYHLRWMLEAQERKVKTGEKIRYIGGGALSETTCQILADITGKTVETVDQPQNTGAVGAAVVAGIGMGLIASFDELKEIIRPVKQFQPNQTNRSVYARNYSVYRKLYPTNKRLFSILNAN